MITAALADRAEALLRAGGLVLFGADTVYGLACAADDAAAVARLVALKGRDERKPNARIAFSLDAADGLLSTLGGRTAQAARELLPGPVTLVLPGGIGLRVPELAPAVAALARITTLCVQSSANVSGAPPAARVKDVAPQIRACVDLVLDGGRLPGTPSTVIDLSDFEGGGEWSLLRPGALSTGVARRVLGRRQIAVTERPL